MMDAKSDSSPSRATTAAPAKEPKEKIRPISYFDETAPADDPELNELLKPRAAKTAPQPQAAPAAKPPSRPVAKTVAQPVRQPAAKPASPPVAKAVQPPSNPAPIPSAQPVAQPPAQKPAQPTQKTETLAIGGATDGSSIPWLIELPTR